MRKILDISLPYGNREPDIFVNAAFAYMELNEPDKCIECMRSAKKHGVVLKKYLSDPSLAPLAEDKRFIALKKSGKTRVVKK
jgi:hypothetical protein